MPDINIGIVVIMVAFALLVLVLLFKRIKVYKQHNENFGKCYKDDD
ncbi:MAG: hypothetical protein AAB632_00005 [Patescibacteria group bacterium]